MDEDDLSLDPIEQLERWLAAARDTSEDADAMTLATATSAGVPSARVVLLRGLDGRGLVFFTNRESRKGQELRENPRAALVLHWWQLGRQVRVEGRVEEVTLAESRAYWATRPRQSRIAAWASPQSRPLGGRGELEAAYTEADSRFAGGEVPLPEFWGGYRVVPQSIEFWTHRDSRLHDRVLYTRSGDSWIRERLAP